MKKNMFKKSLLSSVVCSLMMSGYASAEDANTNNVAEDIEVITVKARKRVEPLQEVPVAVSVVNGDLIERTAIKQTADLDRFVPNVEFGDMPFSGGGITAAIRGIGLAEAERTFEPTVGMSVDGVFFGTLFGAMTDMIDIESAEILRGPQGTLFGRNTMGGVVNLRRKGPTGEAGAKFEATFGSHKRNDYKLVVNTDSFFDDQMAAKFTVFSLNSDNWVKNIYTGKKGDGKDQISFGAKLQYTPSDSVNITLSWDHVDDDSIVANQIPLNTKDNALGVAFNGTIPEVIELSKKYGHDFWDYGVSYSQQPFKLQIESDLFSINSEIDLTDSISLSLITGYQSVDDVYDGEASGLPDIQANGAFISAFDVERVQDYEQFSQEIRVASDFGEGFDFVAGLYYFDSEFNMKPQNTTVGGALAAINYYGQKTEAIAIFGEAYFDINESLRLTTGLRMTLEEKEFYKTIFAGDGVTVNLQCPDANAQYEPCRNPEEEWGKVSPRISLDYKFSDDVMAYASFSQGFRSGGFVARAQKPTEMGPYEPETLNSYEMGIRSEFLDNKIRLNATAFYYDYKDKQEDYTDNFTTPQGLLISTSRIDNAGKATLKGFELETQITLIDNLVIRGSLGLLDSEYDEYLLTAVDDTGKVIGQSDVTSDRLFRFAPDLSYGLGADYFMDLADLGEVVLTANYKFTDEYFATPKADLSGYDRHIIEDHDSLDISLTYNSNSWYKVTIFGNDLLQSEARISRKYDAGFWWTGDQAPGRTWGITIGAEF